MDQRKLVCIPAGSKSVRLARKPALIWLTIGRPEAPFVPVHRVNALLEDEGHDWQWRGGVLWYSSVVPDRTQDVWLLVEYGEEGK